MIEDELRNTLYDILTDVSVGDVPFGVLKTFYEDDVHKLYDELIDTFPNDEMKELETVLHRDGSKMFLFYLYLYKNTGTLVDTRDLPEETKKCIKLAAVFDNHIQLTVFNKLKELSLRKMKIDITLEGFVQPNVNYTDFSAELHEFAKRYGLEVTRFDNPPMRFLNKYELEEIKHD